MQKIEGFKSGKIGTSDYVNHNCELAKTLTYSPVKRCWYCELKFRQCPIFQYLIFSLILIFFSFIISFFLEGEILNSIVISTLILVFVYGYFFIKSTEKIIEASFSEKMAKEALGESKKVLEVRVEARTKELKELTKGLEGQVKERTKELQKRVTELESFHKLTIGREVRMLGLKKENKELRKKIEEYESDKK